MILLKTDPEPLSIDLQRTGLIVVDMQNAFISPGGMSELYGNDMAALQKTIEPTRRVIDFVRKKGCKITYIVHRYSPDMRDSGFPSSPNWFKEKALKSYREHPEWRDKLIMAGTWGADIVGELKPEKEDMVITKLRYSAFSGTSLDKYLRANDIKYLIFTGVKANTCVESTVRDAFHHDYFAILVSDATAANQPDMKEMALQNIARSFGWVITSDVLIKSMT
jgi:ureidoacrylate peracid hydrolase